MNCTTNILGFEVSKLSVKKIVTSSLLDEKQLVVNTLNPHSYAEQKNDREFKNALLSSDVLIPDGSGMVLAAKFLNNTGIGKIAGYNLFFETMTQLSKTGGKVFFLGSTDIVLNKIVQRAKVDFPKVEVYTLSPPFKVDFDSDDIEYFSKKINDIEADVVFVGLTAPKQEKLIVKLKEFTDVKFFSGIGAVFDFYAGTVKRPSDIWLKLHLEWLVRFIGEPKRLWRRNFISTPIFLIDLLKCKIKKVIK
ncbi:MAG: WecB/TagA/CpsF family glycosyltransferase [Colwellia sp.]|nr:WecB/TagA/CpsF family glycosyltransferase [Colwellia sp.]MCW8864946.1 WecB/TagA/CpsF family glycosyltransferase [Colwellia sp.]MCW9082885.1 WecB/TagA/CpsF family glycosyltransferase [Colwellia sp.]